MLPRTRIRSGTLILAVITGLLVATPGRDVSARELVLVQPGYPGSMEEARPFVAKLLEVLAEQEGAALEAGVYHNDEAAGLKAIRERKVELGIVSPGFFLEHREKLQLELLLGSQPASPHYLIVQEGTVRSLADLAGKKVTGTPFLEPRFVRRILFGKPLPALVPGEGEPGDGDPGKKTPEAPAAVDPALYEKWDVSPARYTSRALRYLKRGRRDAVLLSGVDYRGAKRLELLEGLEVLHVTQAVPAAVVVAVGSSDEARRSAWKKALTSLGESESGRDLLKTMGIEKFAPVAAPAVQALLESYGPPSEKTEKAGDS